MNVQKEHRIAVLMLSAKTSRDLTIALVIRGIMEMGGFVKVN